MTPQAKVHEDGRVTVMAVYDPITLDQLLAVTRNRTLANALFGKVGHRPWRLVTGYRGRDELDERLTDAEVSGWRDAAVVPLQAEPTEGGVRGDKRFGHVDVENGTIWGLRSGGHSIEQARRDAADLLSAAAWAERQAESC